MNEKTEFEVLEHEEINGRIFLQFFSGDVTNQFKIECLSRLCTVHGRRGWACLELLRVLPRAGPHLLCGALGPGGPLDT
jgi:hypothetical protein